MTVLTSPLAVVELACAALSAIVIIARAAGNEQSYEYPLRPGVTTSAPETPFDQLQPTSITIADLGDGSTAIALLRQAGLL